jgi:hypothetical protein
MAATSSWVPAAFSMSGSTASGGGGAAGALTVRRDAALAEDDRFVGICGILDSALGEQTRRE